MSLGEPLPRIATDVLDSAAAQQHSSLMVTSGSQRLVVECQRSDRYAIEVTTDLGGALRALARAARRDRGCDAAFLVVDCAAQALLEPIEAMLTHAGVRVAGRSLIDGHETHKSLATTQRLWQGVHDAGVLRRTLVLGIGGGVTCDVAGFVASTYMRGLPYALVPTTLMAQVDAAVGGKVGIDLLGQKNLVGSFFHPIGVIADVTILQELPERVWAAGLAEVIKVAAIGCPELLDLVDPRHQVSLRADPALLAEMVLLAITEKLRHLQSDPYELGDLRRLLNFGHCIGHAVEAEVGFSWLHGECVAVGIAVACRVGARAGVTPTATSKRIHSLLKALDLPTHVPTNRVSDIWGHLRRIERVRDGHLHLVVPTQIGSVTILPDWPAGVAWSDVA